MNDINEIKNKLLVYYSKEELVDIILKAIEYIYDNVAVCAFGNKKLPHWEFDDDNIQNLIKILKGEENEISLNSNNKR